MTHAPHRGPFACVRRAVFRALDTYQHLIGTWRASGRAVRAALYEFHWEPDCIIGTMLAFDSMGCVLCMHRNAAAQPTVILHAIGTCYMQCACMLHACSALHVLRSAP